MLSLIAFQALLKASKIAWTHNTLHTILMVWSLALVLFSLAILMNTRQLEPLYELIPRVKLLMPGYLTPTLMYSGYIVLALAVLLSLAASFESRVGL